MPISQPEPPPPDPPFAFWTSVAILGLGALVITFVVVKLVWESRASSESTGGEGPEEAESEEGASTEPGDDRVV